MAQNGKPRLRGTHETSTLESPLAATWRPRVPEKAVLVGVGRGIEEADLDELAALADSAGAEPVERVLQTRQDPNPATFIGKGKIDRGARRGAPQRRRGRRSSTTSSRPDSCAASRNGSRSR